MIQKQTDRSSIIKVLTAIIAGLLLFIYLQPAHFLLARNSGEDQQKVWIYLNDARLKNSDFIPLDLSQRTMDRLLKMNTAKMDIRSNAIPDIYIRLPIEELVKKIVFYSRSLRAYSAYINPSAINKIRGLPFVKEVVPVKIYHRQVPVELQNRIDKSSEGTDFYGNSYDQLIQLNIPAVHDSGYSGAGVRIAIIDAGFYKDHSAFKHIIDSGRLIAERDFIFNDNNVQDEIPGDTTIYPQSRHGTSVWSIIGGYRPDVQIGVAFGAEFLLAKSERIGSESILEEDLFVEAVEWADQNGADIISSSVAYRDFDYVNDDYQYEQLDGKTTNAAKAINWAFERGILPVICAGNEANYFPYDGGLLTPADAYGALTIGAVNFDGQIAGFSSYGPTFDGRIKPDLCALGIDVYVAMPNTPESFTFGDGTSYSTPLIAGSAALLMERYPKLPPIKIIELLKKYSSRSNSPNERYGWGIPDVYQSIFDPDIITNSEWAPSRNKIYALPNPAVTGVTFTFRWTHVIPNNKPTRLKIYNLLGEQVWSKELYTQISGIDERTYWNLKNLSGEIVPAGVYIVTVIDAHTTIRGKCLVLH